MILDQAKQLARQQWGQEPCGSQHGRHVEFASREFFEAVEQHRYGEYAPWMPRVMDFAGFPGAHLLEVGCGMGTDLLQFARGGAKCIGTDLTPRSIELSRRHFAIFEEEGAFLLSDAEHLPFANEVFDVVYSNGVLHHTPDTAGSVREIHRILRPNGIAKVMLYNRNSLYYLGKIVFLRGFLGGEFLKGNSTADIMSRYVESEDDIARPLVKVFTRRQVMRLFDSFNDVRVEVTQLTRQELRAIGRLMPEALFSFLQRIAGWNLIITARK